VTDDTDSVVYTIDKYYDNPFFLGTANGLTLNENLVVSNHNPDGSIGNYVVMEHVGANRDYYAYNLKDGPTIDGVKAIGTVNLPGGTCIINDGSYSFVDAQYVNLELIGELADVKLARDFLGNVYYKLGTVGTTDTTWDSSWTAAVASAGTTGTDYKTSGGTLLLNITTANGVTTNTLYNKSGVKQFTIDSEGNMTDSTGTAASNNVNVVASAAPKYNLNTLTGSDVTLKLDSAAGSVLDANGSKTNITAGTLTVSASSSGSLGTAADPLEISVTGNIAFNDGGAAANNNAAISSYLTTGSDEAMTFNALNSIVNGADMVISGGTLAGNGGLDASGSGSTLTANFIKLGVGTLMASDSGTATVTITGTDAAKVANLAAKTGGTLNLTATNGDIVVGTGADISGGSTLNVTSDYGRIVNTDGADETLFMIDASTAALRAAGDVDISHMLIKNGSDVTITSLRDAGGKAVGADGAYTSGGGYNGKTFVIGDSETNESTPKDSNVVLKTYGSVTLENDEDSAADGDTLAVTGSDAAGTRGLYLTSLTGGLISNTDNDCWYFNNAYARIQINNSPVVKDKVNVFNGSDVSIVSDYGDLSLSDYQSGDKTSWYVDDSRLLLQLAGDITIDHLAARDRSTVTISSLRDANGKSVAYGETAAAGGKTAFVDWDVDHSTVNIESYDSMLLHDGAEISGGSSVTLRSVMGGFTNSDKFKLRSGHTDFTVDGSTVDATFAQNIIVDYLNELNGADATFRSLRDDNKLSVGDIASATYGGSFESVAWNIARSALRLITWNSVLVNDSASITDGSSVNIHTETGGLSNTDALKTDKTASAHTSWLVDAAAMVVEAARDLAIDHMLIKNGSDVSMLTLRNSKDRTVTDRTAAAGGGSYVGKTFVIDDSATNTGTPKDSSVSLLLYGGMSLLNDEDTAETNALSVTGSDAAGTRGLYLTSLTGGLVSNTAYDCWLFDNANAVIVLKTSPVVTDRILVRNGSDVSMTTDGAMTLSDGAGVDTSLTVLNAKFGLAAAGDIVLDHLASTGGNVTLTSVGGAITSKDWTAADTTANITAKKAVTVGTVGITDNDSKVDTFSAGSTGAGVTVTGATVTGDKLALTSGGDMAVTSLTTSGSAKLDFNAGGTLTNGYWNSTDTEGTVRAKGNITLAGVTVSNGDGKTDTIAVQSTAGTIKADSVTVTGDRITLEGYGDVSVDAVSATNGAVGLKSDTGSVTSKTWSFNNSTADVEAKANVNVIDSVNASNGSNVTVRSVSGQVITSSADSTDATWTATDSNVDIISARNVVIANLNVLGTGVVNVSALADGTGESISGTNGNYVNAATGGILVLENLTIGKDGVLNVYAMGDVSVSDKSDVSGTLNFVKQTKEISNPAEGDAYNGPSGTAVILTGPSAEIGAGASGSSVRTLPGLYLFVNLTKNYTSSQTATLNVYTDSGRTNMVYTETTKTPSDMTSGIAAYVSSGIYSSSLERGRVYYYTITVGGETSSGSFYLPSDTGVFAKLNSMEAMFNSILYGTLAEAIRVAADNDVIQMQGNSSGAAVVGKALTIMRNGFTASGLTAADNTVMVTSDTQYTFYYEGFKITYAYDNKTSLYNVNVEYHFKSAMTGIMMVAAYDANGKMIGLTSENFSAGENGTLGLNLRANGIIKSYKVFLLNTSTKAPEHSAGELSV
jgi:hypothetical protein